YLYHQRIFFYEERLVEALRSRLNLPDIRVDLQDVKAALTAIFARMPTSVGESVPVRLNSEQQYALVMAAFRPFSLVSGGPGTGKTSIVVSLLRLLVRLGVEPEEIALAAPTGKAAHRLVE